MGRFVNDVTGARVSVADEKDHRFEKGWTSADVPPAPIPASAPEISEPGKRGPGRPKKTED